jgi:hypothetical protein
MEKNRIKAILREAFNVPMKEAAPAEGEGKADNAKYEKDYNFVMQKLDGTLLKANQVMAAAGLGNPKDATDRSLFSKKLRKEKNDEGGQYLFNDDDLAKIINVINNPISKM